MCCEIEWCRYFMCACVALFILHTFNVRWRSAARRSATLPHPKLRERERERERENVHFTSLDTHHMPFGVTLDVPLSFLCSILFCVSLSTLSIHFACSCTYPTGRSDKVTLFSSLPPFQGQENISRHRKGKRERDSSSNCPLEQATSLTKHKYIYSSYYTSVRKKYGSFFCPNDAFDRLCAFTQIHTHINSVSLSFFSCLV